MATPRTNSMAAVLSTFVQVIFWLVVILGVITFIILSIGLIGALNGGTVNLPFVQAMAEGVPMGRLLAALISAVVFFTGAAYVCNQLQRILSTLAAGDPFVPENAPRLTRIAIAIGAVEILRISATFLVSATIDLGDGMQAKIGIDPAVWSAVVVLLILAQVFKEGTRLREEEKMTI